MHTPRTTPLRLLPLGAAPTLTALRAQLKAADPLRPAVDRMPRAEVEFLLQHIAEGGALYTADTDAEPLGAFRGFDFRAFA